MKVDSVHLYVLSGIDTNLVGTEISGWRFGIVHRNPLRTDTAYIYKHPIYETIQLSLGNLSYPKYLNTSEDNFYYCFLFKKTDNPLEGLSVGKAIRLFKTCSFGMSFPITLNPSNPIIVNTPYDLANNNFGKLVPFSIDGNELHSLDDILQQLAHVECHSKINNMIDFYNDSFRVVHYAVSFLLRVICMEISIDSEKGIKKALANSISSLIGENDDEKEKIQKDIREIYQARSEYVHNGSKDFLNDELIFKANDYARRTIFNLILQ